jgi:predicted amidophosphoribosyltransferase
MRHAMTRLTRMFRPPSPVYRALRHLWTGFAPPKCVGCRAELVDTENSFCEPCDRLADPVLSPACPRCLEPRQRSPGRGTVGADILCRRCRDSPPPFQTVDARWLYRDSVSDALKAVKYGGDLWRLHRMALCTREWAHALEPSAVDDDDVGICPVPMTPADLRTRGFNVSVLLARWWFDRFDYPIQKTVPTPAQTGLPREQRLENLKDAFEPHRTARIAGRRWLVIDDVVTTGTTVRRVAATLHEAGASSVRVVSVARAGWLD